MKFLAALLSLLLPTAAVWSASNIIPTPFSAGFRTVYISPTGNDNASGLITQPMKTPQGAVRRLQGVGTIIVTPGDYTNTPATSYHLNGALCTNIMINADGPGAVRFFSGTQFLASAVTLVSGSTYSLTFDNDSWIQSNAPTRQYIFETGVGSVEGFIPLSERSPLQPNNWYRLQEFARLTNASSLALLATAASSAYFPSNNTIFFKYSDAGVPGSRAIWLPSRFDTNSFVFGCQEYTQIRMNRIRHYFGFSGFDMSQAGLFRADDCAVFGSYYSGFYSTNTATGGRSEFVRCESAANGDDGFSFGDGVIFGGDVTNLVSINLSDCWSHDNGDEGVSPHYGTEVSIWGGSFEFNFSGGITAYAGARINARNCRVYGNLIGLSLAGAPSFGNVGWATNILTQIEIRNSAIFGNNQGVGFEGGQSNLQAVIQNCWLSNVFNFLPYRATSNHLVRIVDCSFGNNSFALQDSHPTFGPPSVAGYCFTANSANRVCNANEGLTFTVASYVNGTYTNELTDRVVSMPNNTTAAGRTNSLPDAVVNAGRSITIFDSGRTASGTNIWIKTINSQTINGGPVITNSVSDGGFIEVISTGSGWWIVGRL